MLSSILSDIKVSNSEHVQFFLKAIILPKIVDVLGNNKMYMECTAYRTYKVGKV